MSLVNLVNLSSKIKLDVLGDNLVPSAAQPYIERALALCSGRPLTLHFRDVITSFVVPTFGTT